VVGAARDLAAADDVVVRALRLIVFSGSVAALRHAPSLRAV
jgi:hypothetical protein